MWVVQSSLKPNFDSQYLLCFHVHRELTFGHRLHFHYFLYMRNPSSPPTQLLITLNPYKSKQTLDAKLCNPHSPLLWVKSMSAAIQSLCKSRLKSIDQIIRNCTKTKTNPKKKFTKKHKKASTNPRSKTRLSLWHMVKTKTVKTQSSKQNSKRD